MMVRLNRSCATHPQAKRISVNWTSTALIAGSSLVFAPLMAAHAEGPAETAAPAAQATQAEGGAVVLEEIIITARRKSELLQDVPQTVTAVTPTELQKLNLQNLTDLSGVVPGLQIVASPNPSLDSNTFRGVSFQPASGTQNTLGFYINDTFVTNNFVTQSNFDIGQIEVLSGPQGTLRGEPSPSGSLTITTRRPDLEQFGGYVNLTGTAFDNTNENGAFNLPIIPGKLAVRLAGIAQENDLDGVKSVNTSADPYYHNYAGRASVRFEPIDSIEANVVYQHSFWHLTQFPQVEGPGAPGGVTNAPANYNGPAITPFELRGVQTFPNTTYNFSDLVTGQLDWHVLGQVVTYDGSYWKYANNNGDGALTANQAPGITAANPIPRLPFQFDTPSIVEYVQTDEVRIASEAPKFGFLDYTAGFFYRNTRNEVNVVQNPTFLPGSFGTPAAPADPFIYDPKYTLQAYIQSPAQEKEYSEFLHFTFHLPDDTELTAGGRYIDYKKTGSILVTLPKSGVYVAAAIPVPCSALTGILPGIQKSVYPGVCDIPTADLASIPSVGLAYTPQNLSDHPFVYNASLSHKLNKDLLIYISTGSSWRPPGVSVGIYNGANDPTLNSLLHLQPEKSYEYEGGFKWTFLQERARLNVAYYHQKFNDLIYNGLPAYYLQNNAGVQSVVPFAFNSNPDAILNGVSLDTGLRLTRQWSYDLSASYSNGHLTGSEIPCSPPNGNTSIGAFPPGTYIFLCPSHASISVAPNFNFSTQTEYDTPIPGKSGIDGFVRGLYVFYGRNPHASQYYVAPSYGILNFYTGLRSPDGAWEGAFFVKNLLNTQKVLYSGVGNPPIDQLRGAFGSSGYYNVGITPRQEAGLTFTYSFGSR